MTWVLLAQRKTELQRTKADYTAEDLVISRESRQRARYWSFEQMKVRNQQAASLREIQSDYDEEKTSLRERIQNLRNGGDDPENETIDSLQDMLDEAKEDYTLATNSEKQYFEDILEDYESSANDEDVQFQQDRNVIEALMEAIGQEIQAVTQAMSQAVQAEVVKLS